MTFALMYRRTVSTTTGPTPTYALRRADGDVFQLEQDLVVFYDVAGVGGHPIGAATVTDLLYIVRDEERSESGGFEVEGRFGEDDEPLTAVGAEAFFTERGFAVFYDDLARAGTQILAVRCSEVHQIRQVPILRQLR